MAMNSTNLSAARSSHFSQTCTRLSRYLKQNGSFPDVFPTFNHNFDSGSGARLGAPVQTMDLLPAIEKSNADPVSLLPGKKSDSDLCSAIANAKSSPPMTIFYGGRVIVLNDLPPTKATEIISLAHKSTAAVAEPPALPAAQPPADSDLPIARKNSLSRFLAKRKDRITGHAPYPVVNNKSAAAAAPPKSVVKTEPWLGLSSPQLPLH